MNYVQIDCAQEPSKMLLLLSLQHIFTTHLQHFDKFLLSPYISIKQSLPSIQIRKLYEASSLSVVCNTIHCSKEYRHTLTHLNHSYAHIIGIHLWHQSISQHQKLFQSQSNAQQSKNECFTFDFGVSLPKRVSNPVKNRFRRIPIMKIKEGTRKAFKNSRYYVHE